MKRRTVVCFRVAAHPSSTLMAFLQDFSTWLCRHRSQLKTQEVRQPRFPAMTNGLPERRFTGFHKFMTSDTKQALVGTPLLESGKVDMGKNSSLAKAAWDALEPAVREQFELDAREDARLCKEKARETAEAVNDDFDRAR